MDAAASDMLGTGYAGDTIQADRICIAFGAMRLSHSKIHVTEPYYEGIRVGVDLGSMRSRAWAPDPRATREELAALGRVHHDYQGRRRTIADDLVTAGFQIHATSSVDVRNGQGERTGVEDWPCVFNPPKDFAAGLDRPPPPPAVRRALGAP